MAYDVKAVKRQWEGYETPQRWGRYPVEHEPIRRHCQMLDDMNPRFLEDGHCPPVMVDYIFINTAFIRGCLCRVVTDWMGDDGFVKSLGFQMRRPNFVGETIVARGRVKKKSPDGRVDLELWLENAGEVTVPGRRQ
ncbi:MAG: hypothetical protein HYR50_07515 [Candidatus Rokubacteria bacterium]|nr:hypothetical protein [Candidatus Rokubacteria bacterium]